MTRSKIPDIDEDPVNSQEEKVEANETLEQDVATDAVDATDRSTKTKKGKQT